MAWSCANGQWGVSEDEASSLRHYFLFRGLYNTSKTFENELKQDREKAFRVDKIMDQILLYISTYDILGLRDYWNFLEMRIFSAVDQTLCENVQKLHRGLLRYYVTYAHQQGKNEKVVEFFDKMSVELSNNAEWKEWFVMPFLKSPETYNTFEMYFNKQWQDTLMLSLHNFLCLALTNMKKPALLGYEEDKKKIESLEFENAILKRRIKELSSKMSEDAIAGGKCSTVGEWIGAPSSGDIIPNRNLEFLDDFQELNNSKRDESSSILKLTSSSAPMSPLPIMSFLKNFTGTSSSSASSKKSLPPMNRSIRGTDLLVERSDQGGGSNEVQRSSSLGGRIPPSGDSTETENSETDISRSSQLSSDPQPNESVVQLDLKHQDYVISSQEIYADHAASVVTCRFSSTGKSVVSLDSDGILKIWSCIPSPKTLSGTMSKSVLTAIEWLPASDRLLLLGSKVGDIRLFDAKDRKVIKEAHVDVNFPKMNSIAIHPDGSSFVTSSHGRVVSGSSFSRVNQFRLGLLTLWDLNSDIKQKRFLPISPCPVAINSMMYNQRGNLLLTGGCDGRIRVYDVRNQNSIADWLAHDGDICTVSFASNSSSTCFSFAADGSLVQWSLEKMGHKVKQFDITETNGSRNVCSASGSGRSFVLNSSNSSVVIGWENTAAIYKIYSKLDSRSCLPIGDGTSIATCVDWSEHRLPNICLIGTQRGIVIVTSLDMRT